MKVCLTVHDPDEKKDATKSPSKKKQKEKRKSRLQKKYLNSGVKRVIILALVENVPEKYYNVEKLLDMLKIESISFVLAADLKLQNVLCGIQAHG